MHRNIGAVQTGILIIILLELQATKLFTHRVVSRLFKAKMLRYSAAFPIKILLLLNPPVRQKLNTFSFTGIFIKNILFCNIFRCAKHSYGKHLYLERKKDSDITELQGN